jgi:hypothetical protein
MKRQQQAVHQSGRFAIIAWRRRQLIGAGFEPVLAPRLAATPGIDLHELLTLVDRGCPASLAARIIEPVTDTAAAHWTACRC